MTAQKSSRSKTRVVPIFPNSNKAVSDYLQQNHLDWAPLREIDFDSLGVSGTPTMILLNANGTIENIWVGKIPEDQEAKLIDEIFLTES